MLLAELFPYAHVVYDIFMLLYFITVLTVIGVVLSENRNPVKSLAWVSVLVLLPIVGLILYLLFGRSLKGVHMISRQGLEQLRKQFKYRNVEINSLELSDNSKQIIKLVNSLTTPHLFVGNHIDIYTAGKDKFAQLKKDLSAAKRYIHLQYFIIENDEIGHAIRDILEAKVAEGVTVRVLYDDLGSFTWNPVFFNHMRKAGVAAHPFMKLSPTNFANRLNWRNHRKIVVIDGEIGYIGGMNIADRYVTPKGKHDPWRDTHLRVTGEAVAALQYSFAIDWNFMERTVLTETAMHYDEKPQQDDVMQVLGSGPTSDWNNLSMVFLKAISSAKRTIFIQTPYFLPNDGLLAALQSAALAKVDVRIMIPRKPDSWMLRLASNSYIKSCLQAGIRIYFYEPTMLHSKVMIIDDELVTTGSTNFDFRSLEHNFECNAFIYSHSFCSRMKEIFFEDQHHCTRIILSHWKRRSVVLKALESIVRLFSPIL